MDYMTVPLYRTVYLHLKQRIDAGIYPRGEAMPSESRLVQEFDVSLITLRRAIHELVLDGLVERRQGLGSFVRSRGREVMISLTRFSADVVTGRLRLTRTLLQDEMAPASPEVAEKLAVQPGSMLRHLVRLDAEGGEPMSVDELFIPAVFDPGISAEAAGSPLFVTLWQEQAGITLGRTEYEITVQPAGKTDRQLLQIDAKTPLLVEAELIFDASDRPALWVVTRYRGDRCRLSGGGPMPKA
jgi:GntR family transcriptional regulator